MSEYFFQHLSRKIKSAKTIEKPKNKIQLNTTLIQSKLLKNKLVHSTSQKEYSLTQRDNYEDSSQHQLISISQLLNSKIQFQSPQDFKNQIISLVEHSHSLEHQIKLLNKEIEKLQYIINFLTIAQHKRDDIIQQLQAENKKIRDQIVDKEQEILKMEGKVILKDKLPRTTGNKRSLSRNNSPLKGLFRDRDLVEDNKIELLSLEVETTSQTNQRYNTYSHVKLLNEFLGSNPDTFEHNIQNLKSSRISFLFEALDRTIEEHRILFTIVGKMRALQNAAVQLSVQPTLNKSLDITVKSLCENLECDRASVFVFDAEKEELFTRVLKGTREIRIPYKKGIVGSVFITGQLLNILNAYGDSRFDQTSDKLNNYKTTTILCCPVKDTNDCTIGVVQAVNKFKGFFTKDDEKLIQIIATQVGVALREGLAQDESVVRHNYQRHLITVLEYAAATTTESALLSESEKYLKEMFNVQHCRIYLYTKEIYGSTLFRWEKDEKISYPANIGILGEAIRKMKPLSILCPYQHLKFNNQTDLDTNLPLYTFPILDERDDSLFAIIQIVNSKGIQVVSSQSQINKMTLLDYDMLACFGKFFVKKYISLQK